MDALKLNVLSSPVDSCSQVISVELYAYPNTLQSAWTFISRSEWTLIEETSPRAVCSAAGFPDFLCRGDGRHHATSSKVVQPILEPRRLARSEALRVPSKVPAVSWADVERLDAALAAACRDLAAAYGYDADPRYHPQSLDTTAFKA
mgnify:CR=1 FL=1